ncbi:alpha/beta fold hydrolase [Ruegeria faecimaris]|uniref:Pimeloyl-ACP methyl ester carboxylesterase n=1 Tax=Ruegeria faecimaris TaxID=686389 RepID=A0A521F2T1_9RHOB|nr:alpha/beta fold hydrolase [Ruegeria faecimaris]SMO90473.1 Pimeloyl-ACP methyl ester carboxylesterase [Ruegeria faecimaris]
MTPVVFVHGFLGGSQHWLGQVDALAGFNVVALDLPGFGENAHLEAPASIAGFAEWALRELSARGIERFILIGHSMGGMIVQEMVARAPDRIDQLVLYGTGTIGILPGRFETIDTSKHRANTEGPRATARRIAATWFLDRGKAAAYEDCAMIAEQCSLQTMLIGLDAMESWSGAKHLADIMTRTLVIWGDRDRTYPWSQTEQLWQSIPDANLAVIPGCAHATHLEKPGLFNSILRDFCTA